MATKNISGFVSNGSLHKFKAIPGARGESAILYYIRILKNDLCVDSDGITHGTVYWEVVRNVGGEEERVSVDFGQHVMQIPNRQWQDASYDSDTNILDSESLFDDLTYSSIGSPTTINLAFYVDNELAAITQAQVCVNGKTGQTGPRGEAAIFDTSGNTITSLHDDIGNDEANTMSQKAITKAIADSTCHLVNLDVTKLSGLVIDSNGGVSTDSNNYRYVFYTAVSEGDIVSVECTGGSNSYSKAAALYDAIPADGGTATELFSYVVNAESLISTFVIPSDGYLGVSNIGASSACVIKKYAKETDDLYNSVNDIENNANDLSDKILAATVGDWNVLTKTQVTSTVINASGTIASSASANRIFYTQASKGDIIRVSVTGSDATTNRIGCFSSYVNDTVATKIIAEIGDATFTKDFFMPADGYVVVYVKSTTNVTFSKAVSLAQYTNEKIAEIDPDLGANVTLIDGHDSTKLSHWIDVSNGNIWRSTTSNNRGMVIEAESLRGKRVVVTPPSGVTSGIAFVLAKSTGNTSTVFYSTDIDYNHLISVSSKTSFIVPDDVSYLYVHSKINGNDVFPTVILYRPSGEAVKELEENIEDLRQKVSVDEGIVFHVDAVNGDDTNDGGTKATALRTFAKALELSGADVSIMLHGDIYEPINFTTLKKSVTLRGENGRLNRIICGCVITEGEVTADSGIYLLDYGDIEFANGRTGGLAGNYWIYQHDVDDPKTLVVDDERHPLHRGKQYRCSSKRIVYASSLSALKSSTVSAYFYDEDEGLLYTNVLPTVNNPIVLPLYSEYGVRYSGQNLVMGNIEVLYGSVNLNGSSNAYCYDCAARYAYNDGCWTWDNAKGLLLRRCEAAGTICGTTGTGGGDGFNAHATGAGGDTRIIYETATLDNCWAHDCNDDGFSDHYRTETNIIGGLYEYCGKGGITPSFASQTTIQGAESRRNSGAGILYTGSTTSNYGRTGGCAVAIDCYCHDNGTNNYCVTGGTQDYKNTLIAIGCRSARAGQSNDASNGYGYKANGDYDVLRVVNCTDRGSLSGDYYNALVENSFNMFVEATQSEIDTMIAQNTWDEGVIYYTVEEE